MLIKSQSKTETADASVVCKPNPCKNGGICNGEDGSCYCIGGFIGRLCETVKGDSTVAPTSDPAKTAAEQTAKSESTTETADASMVCKPNPCKNKGICNGEDGTCYCINGFIGQLCETANEETRMATTADPSKTTREQATDSVSTELKSTAKNCKICQEHAKIFIENVNQLFLINRKAPANSPCC